MAVTVPSLDRLSLRGHGNISVTGVNSRSLTVALPGSGNIGATGTTTKLDVTISGEGTALMRQLVARDAKAALKGDGTTTAANRRERAANRCDPHGAISARR